MSFDLTSILTGGAGGVLGIIGNLTNTLIAMRQEKQRNDYQLALIPLQMNADIERTKANVALEVEKGAGAAFTESQRSDRLDGRESPWAANLKATIRPACLFLLMTGTLAIYTSGNPSQDMKDYISQNVVINCSMAISWYFGARASALVMQGFKSKAGNT